MRVAVLSIVLVSAASASAVEPAVKTNRKSAPTVIQLRLVDQSMLRGTLSDATLEVATKYGRLTIPTADIVRIDFGLRPTPEQQKRVVAAIAQIASASEKSQADGIAELIKLREFAIPALTQATNSDDGDLAIRARDALSQVKSAVGRDAETARLEDAVHTDGFTIVGRIEASAVRLRTSHFGDLSLKIADVRSLQSSDRSDRETIVTNVLPDPGNLITYEQQLGKTFLFRVTGLAGGSLWGTEVYTTDSTLGAAAVHLGLLRVGQTGVVRVQMMASPPTFNGSQRNGLISSTYGVYRAAYKLSKP